MPVCTSRIPTGSTCRSSIRDKRGAKEFGSPDPEQTVYKWPVGILTRRPSLLISLFCRGGFPRSLRLPACFLGFKKCLHRSIFLRGPRFRTGFLRGPQSGGLFAGIISACRLLRFDWHAWSLAGDNRAASLGFRRALLIHDLGRRAPQLGCRIFARRLNGSFWNDRFQVRAVFA